MTNIVIEPYTLRIYSSGTTANLDFRPITTSITQLLLLL